jgi:hypothetical protein
MQVDGIEPLLFGELLDGAAAVVAEDDDLLDMGFCEGGCGVLD